METTRQGQQQQAATSERVQCCNAPRRLLYSSSVFGSAHTPSATLHLLDPRSSSCMRPAWTARRLLHACLALALASAVLLLSAVALRVCTQPVVQTQPRKQASTAAHAAAAAMQQRLRHVLVSAASSSCRSPSRLAAPARMLRTRAAAGSAHALPCQQQQHAAASAAVAAAHACSKRAATLGALTSACAGVVLWSWQPAPAAAARRPAAAGMSTAAAAGAGDGSTAPDDTGVIVVYVTAPSAEVGTSLARALVEAQLVACVNLLPGVTSIYRWQGKVETDAEVLLVIKTRRALLQQLTDKVTELHPYDMPEVIALPVVGGSAAYLKWVADSTAPPA